MNAIASRFVGSVKRECLSKMIFFGEAHLRLALAEFVAHYNADRPHQGIGNVQQSTEPPIVETGEVVADERLSGLPRSYRRAA